ncbi:hypothetical protein HR09_07700 [Porphyromonas gulae]|nr:hypothetical protein HR09_07700 [Porphyromonas gulae]
MVGTWQKDLQQASIVSKPAPKRTISMDKKDATILRPDLMCSIRITAGKSFNPYKYIKLMCNTSVTVFRIRIGRILAKGKRS